MSRFITQRQFAERAQVSEMSVSKAVKKGHLVRGLDGLDPDEPRNARWIARHRAGFDSRNRVLSTHRGSRRKDDGASIDGIDLDQLRAEMNLDELLTPRYREGCVNLDSDVRALRDAFRAELAITTGLLRADFAIFDGNLAALLIKTDEDIAAAKAEILAAIAALAARIEAFERKT